MPGTTGIYHAGSLAVQERVGVRELAARMGRASGEGIKPVAAAFLEIQPLLVVSAADPSTSRVWTSPLTGTPGFVRATGTHQISVIGRAPETDPLATALATPGTPLGTIALDPRTRRRMRLNGRVRPTARGYAVEADRVFGNCPKYLQKRDSYEVVAGRGAEAARRGSELTSEQAEFIASADTFFLGTVHAEGADTSHRGGNPGFVSVDSPGELSWRDYAGNSMFLSLGNIEADPRTGLLFLDWQTGTTLQLTGEALLEFGADSGADSGEERRVRFTVTEVVERPSAVPLRWSAPEYSPANPDLAG
ncbi:pyridoxamine 5'-phosphate oxidase family protein [Streptomyces sp. NPDC046909]|uniref:pyridoxamine 5'-phosphate oxidase family protein n=1 Tax=Streptomyces sp. NPDC046909 TaxID=3155617 RepID=UPI0033EDE20F